MSENKKSKCIDEFSNISEGHKIMVNSLAYCINTLEIMQDKIDVEFNKLNIRVKKLEGK